MQQHSHQDIFTRVYIDICKDEITELARLFLNDNAPVGYDDVYDSILPELREYIGSAKIGLMIKTSLLTNMAAYLAGSILHPDDGEARDNYASRRMLELVSDGISDELAGLPVQEWKPPFD